MRTWRNEEQIVEKWKKRHYTRLGSSAVLIIALIIEKKMKLLLRGEFVFGTNPAKQGSTLLSGRHVVLSLWFSESERNCV